VEQAAYDGLKPTWRALPSAVREHCLSLASLGGPGSLPCWKRAFKLRSMLVSRTSSASFDT